MDEAVHALATAALADGVKRLALSCRTIERVELTVTMPQGGSVAVMDCHLPIVLAKVLS